MTERVFERGHHQPRSSVTMVHRPLPRTRRLTSGCTSDRAVLSSRWRVGTSGSCASRPHQRPNGPASVVPPPVTAAQRSVLYAVRRRGEATRRRRRHALGITTSGARQHLAALVEMGLVETYLATRAPGQQGRTEQVYRMAPAAESLFPHAYGELTNQLLAYVPAGAVTEAFEHRRDDRIAGARGPGSPVTAGSAPRSPSWPASSTRTATSRPSSRSGATRSASPSATAPSSPSPASTRRPARRSSSSCAPRCRRRRSSGVTHMMAGAHSCSYEVRKRA